METPRPEYAGFVTRAIAFVVDAAIVNAAAIIFAGAVALGVSVLPGSHALRGAGVILAGAAYVAWCIGYWSTFWSTTGQTPGDRVMHLRVQRLDGESLHWVMAVVRVIATALAALPLLAGFIPILLTPRRRGVHDWIAGTVVLYTEALPALAPAAQARALRARTGARPLGAEPPGGALDDGADHAVKGAVGRVDGLNTDQNGHRPADVDVELGLGRLPGDQRAGVELGDVTGERRP
jgi:uncharacterized RDD family membrane protein YckC